MTRAELRAAVRTLLRNRQDVLTDADINAALNVAYAQLVRMRVPVGRVFHALEFHELQGTWDLSTVQGTEAYDYPQDVVAVRGAFLELPSGSRLKLRSLDWQAYQRRRGTFGAPFWFTRYGRKLWLSPVPDDAYSIVVPVVNKPAALDSDTASPVIPEAYHLPIAYLAAHDLASRFLDEHADSHLARATAMLARLRTDDALETWDASNRPLGR